MSNIYLKLTIEAFSKLRFSAFKTFVNRSVFGKLQLMQISLNFTNSSCNIKIRRLEQNYVWLFYYFNFEMNYDALKSKSSCILLKKNISSTLPEYAYFYISKSITLYTFVSCF